MGKFTHSYVIIGTTAKALVDFYRAQDTQVFIFQDERSVCAVCEEDEAEFSLIAEVTSEFQAVALFGQVFDSSVFVGTIYKQGVAIDEYIDYPEAVFSYGSDGLILNLNRVLTIEQRAAEWANLFGVSENESTLANIFRRRDKYVFAEEFFDSLLEVLGLPAVLVGMEYEELKDAYKSNPETRKALLRVK